MDRLHYFTFTVHKMASANRLFISFSSFRPNNNELFNPVMRTDRMHSHKNHTAVDITSAGVGAMCLIRCVWCQANWKKETLFYGSCMIWDPSDFLSSETCQTTFERKSSKTFPIFFLLHSVVSNATGVKQNTELRSGRTQSLLSRWFAWIINLLVTCCNANDPHDF